MSLNRSSRARIRRMALAGAVSASLAVSLTPATAFAEVVQDKSCVADNKIVAAHSGTFEWSLRDSFVNYVTGFVARGSVESTGSVTDAGSGKNWTFTAGQAYSADPNSVTLFVPGTLHFTGHGEGENAKLDNTFSNFRLEITGTQAVMYLDAKFRKFEGMTTVGEWETMNNVRFAEWTLSEPFTGQWGETVTFTSDGVGYLTEEGKVAFGGFYNAEKEPVSPLKVGSVTFGEDCDKPDSEPVPGDGDADGGDSETPGDADGSDAGEGDTDNGNTDGGDADGGDSETPGDADGSDAGEGDTDNGNTDGGDADGGDSETPGDADGSDAGEGDTDNGNTDGGDADGGDSETPGDADGGDAGEGDTDNGNTDGGDADGGDSETPGDADGGDAGEGDTDNGNTDGGDADGGDSETPGDADGGDHHTPGHDSDSNDTKPEDGHKPSTDNDGGMKPSTDGHDSTDDHNHGAPAGNNNNGSHGGTHADHSHGSSGLANTGASVMSTTGMALGLILTGAAAVFLAHRRKNA
ncbi:MULTISPECIES: HtaA domain-containing protein [Corynebacterium]|uniref:HtaA domain-containing protein n=1 Tax=Corynebacterium TaxID=1716 RepID=UPI00124C3E6C|nr:MULTISPECIES: HtaA domain-containing protein [Corynebacterium]